MTSHTLPDDPVYAFCPAYDIDNMPQQIRIVFDSMPGYVPTALVALTLEDAERICDRLNARIGSTGPMPGPPSPAAPCPPPAMKPPIEPGKPVYSRQRALRHLRATGRWGSHVA